MLGNKTTLLLMMATSLIALSTARAAEPATAIKDTKEKPAVTATQLDAVTTTATRNPETINDIASTVSVIDADTLERNSATSIRDAIRYEPGVSISNQPTRGGAAGYSIRGIENNRVLMLLDGQAIPDFPGSNFGTPNGYSRDIVDLDSLKQIEIIRGPASVLYGSDAVGGIVSYVSKDPADYLDMVGKDWYGSLKLGYSSADHSFTESMTGAARVGDFEMMGLLTRRDGEEIESKGSVPNSPALTTGRGIKNNPMDVDTTSFLSKLIWHATTSDTLKLTGEYYKKNLDVNVLTEVSATPGATTSSVNSSRAQDETERKRIAIDYVHDAKFGFIDRLELKAFYTQLDRNEHSEQILGLTASQKFRVSDFGYTQDIFGAEAQLNSSFNVGGLLNELTYGLSGEYSETERPRYRTQADYLTGASPTTLFCTAPGFCEQFPNKTFPDNDLLKVGFYGQDKISFGSWTITPGARVDYYKMTPHSDPLFVSSGGAAVSEFSKWHLSPKLGATYKITQEYTGFAQYSHGFRIPPYDSANQTFTNFSHFYGILPNPDLKPETSNGVEAGLRGKFSSGSSFSTSIFYNQYKDFIDTVDVSGTPGALPPPLTTFQYQNLSKVNIYGAEARGDYRFHPNWTLLGSIAYAYGEDDETHLPIDSVDPVKLVSGLRYDTESWGGAFTVTHAWTHSRNSAATNYSAPNYTVLDLTAYYEVLPTFTINAGVFNLTDEKYYLSTDLRGVAATSVALDRYSQPGRNFGVNTTIRF